MELKSLSCDGAATTLPFFRVMRSRCLELSKTSLDHRKAEKRRCFKSFLPQRYQKIPKRCPNMFQKSVSKNRPTFQLKRNMFPASKKTTKWRSEMFILETFGEKRVQAWLFFKRVPLKNRRHGLFPLYILSHCMRPCQIHQLSH